MSKSNDVVGWYANAFKGWQIKLLGPKPTVANLATIHALGARPGKQALASAMALRDCGVTGGQIVIACGAPQLNKMRGFITDGLLKREAVPPTSEGHTVYKLTVTAKGSTRVKKGIEALPKAAPVKAAITGQPKPARKPKAAPVTAPAATPAPAEAPATQA